MRVPVAVLIVVIASAPVFARQATHHRYRRDATTTSVDPHHPDDVALDRKIGSICRGC